MYILQADVGFFIFFLFKFYFSLGLTSFIPSLSKQVVSSHQADVGFFNLFLFNLNFSWGFCIFYTITLQAGCKFSLSIQIYGLHSPSRCWPLFFKSYFMRFNIFHTLNLQPDFMFSLSMEVLGLHSPSRCWPFQFIFIQS